MADDELEAQKQADEAVSGLGDLTEEVDADDPETGTVGTPAGHDDNEAGVTD